MSTERTQKGKSIIAFPAHFTIIDIETTGLSPTNDEIIEISALRVRGHAVTETFTSLVKPNQMLTNRITKLTGITNEMVANAPDITTVLPQFYRFVGKDTLIGHNINFDINFIYDNLERIYDEPLPNDFIDTMRIFKKLHPELEHHRLMDVADFYQIDYSGAHRSLADCKITFAGYTCLKNDVIDKFGSVNAFVNAPPKK